MYGNADVGAKLAIIAVFTDNFSCLYNARWFLTLFWQKKTKILRLSGPSASHLAYFESFSLPMQYPELLVASYNNNEDAPHEPDGVALVWNMKYKKTTPEYVFHCQV